MDQQQLDLNNALSTFSTDNRTNYKKVYDWNKTFGVKMLDNIDPSIFSKDPKLIQYRMSLIREEVKELEDAVNKHDIKETIDALSDILVVVYGMGASLGINLDETMHLVNESNMSKSCKTEEEAIESVEWYLKNEPRYDTPSYKKSDDGKYWIVYNKSTNKILKSIKWQIVNFGEYLDKKK